MGLQAIATKIFGRLVDRYSQYFELLKTSLPQSDIKIPFRVYLSLSFLIITIVFFLSFILTFIAFTIFQRPLLMTILYSLLTSTLITVLEFGFIFYYPIQKASSRRKNIETNLPFVITHMGALSESGIPPYVMFRLISAFKEYGEISKEMQKIVRNIDVFGLDPITAIKEVAKRTPSEAFKQLLMGFVTTTESGGNIKLYLKEVGEQAMFEWRTRRERFIRFLDTFAEFYTGIVIAAPLFLIALLSVMIMVEPNIGGWSILDLTKIGIFVVIPLINIGFILFLRGIEVEM